MDLISNNTHVFCKFNIENVIYGNFEGIRDYIKEITKILCVN